MARQDHDAKPTPAGPERTGARDVERVAYWLDDAFTVPGTRFRVGFDGLAGLVPGVGDALVTVPALWIVLRGIGAGVPNAVVARMVGNVLLDSVLGTVPVVGDLFDFAWKANRR